MSVETSDEAHSHAVHPSKASSGNFKREGTYYKLIAVVPFAPGVPILRSEVLLPQLGYVVAAQRCGVTPGYLCDATWRPADCIAASCPFSACRLPATLLSRLGAAHPRCKAQPPCITTTRCRLLIGGAALTSFLFRPVDASRTSFGDAEVSTLNYDFQAVVKLGGLCQGQTAHTLHRSALQHASKRRLAGRAGCR